nr:phospholipase-like, aminotransferase-like mobile domain protein [Tanacetum cinerariifolium]
AILELVLLGQEPRHNVPDWCLRLVNDRKVWYIWGSYIWPTLYSSLRNANVKRWPVFYVTPEDESGYPPKYTLSGFTWAFEDPAVTLACRMEYLDDHTKIVPFTYHLGDDIDIQFGRGEFCLLIGLRFGVDISSLYIKGHIPFRRRVFDSAMDGYLITASMLEAKITSEEFSTINDHDDVSLCLLAILELVLLGQEPRHNVPDWCL